jgi:hypothetical protein
MPSLDPPKSPGLFHSQGNQGCVGVVPPCLLPSTICRRFRDWGNHGGIAPTKNETALGARGDLALIVKQQSITRFDVKLTPMGSWSVPIDVACNPYDCGIALEQLSAAGASQNATPAQLKQLESIVQQAENNTPVRSGELTNYQLEIEQHQ